MKVIYGSYILYASYIQYKKNDLCFSNFSSSIELTEAVVILHVCACSVAQLYLTHARLLCPWEFLGQNTGVGCHFLLQGIFLTQGSNPSLLCLLHWQAGSLSLSHLGSSSFCTSPPKMWASISCCFLVLILLISPRTLLLISDNSFFTNFSIKTVFIINKN